MKNKPRHNSKRNTVIKTIRAFTTDKAPMMLKIENRKNPVHAVCLALESPDYKWRTVEGIAKETGINPAIVRRVIGKLGEHVAKSSVPSTMGADLFTTRRHLRQNESILSRFGAILRNRAA